MRLFSIIQWHHFAYMVISLALLGYGLSGTFLALNSHRLMPHFRSIFVVNILLFSIGTMICFLLAQQIPFNPQELLWDFKQYWYLLLLYLILSLPFFFAANAIGLALMACRIEISRIYAADMLGAGIGSAGIVLLLFLGFPDSILRILATLGMITAAIACWEMRRGEQVKWVILICSLLPLLLPTEWTQLKISPYKGLSQQLHIEGSKIVSEYSSPLGLLTIVENNTVPLRHAPGLSINATQEPPAQVAVFTDADAMTAITQNTLGVAGMPHLSYLDQMTSAAPYHFQKVERVLVLGAGGGAEVLQAQYNGVKEIEAVELNPQMISLLRGEYAAFSGNIYNSANIQVHIDEARGFVARAQDKEKYEVIQVTLFDDFHSSSGGLYALNESYLYTVEALQQYLGLLKPNGWLTITRWIKLPPRDTLKLFATAVDALEESEAAQVSQQLAFIRSWQTGTLLIKNGLINKQDIDALKSFAQQRSFDIAYYPGIAENETNKFNRLRDPLFYQAANALLGDDKSRYLNDYKFNIFPASDDRPYYFNFFKWVALPEVISLIGRGGMPLLELGYLVLVATLLQAILASLVLIVLPLISFKRSNRPLNGEGAYYFRVFSYFLALGLAFLFIEIAFIQKFILFLHHPTYSIAVVLAAFLVFSGIGSRFSASYCQKAKQYKGITLSIVGIVVLGVGYLLMLEQIFAFFIDTPVLLKIIITILLIAPMAFFMGMPFPLGLSLLGQQKPKLIPWVWGVNGCASVISAVLATLLAIHFGFTLVVLAALAIYLTAAIVINWQHDARPSIAIH
jgi:spermidine synthase/MFS family permease